MRNKGPGPGQVRQFAEDVQYWGGESKRIKGIKAAIAWVMGDNKRNPVTEKTEAHPPDMKAIAEAAKRADAKPQNVDDASFGYYSGVKECLEWIGAGGNRPEEWP